MVKKIFSTGLPKLDWFIGGLQPGDSSLLFLSEIRLGYPTIESVIHYAAQAGIPVVYLSVDDSFLNLFANHKKVKYCNFSKYKNQPVRLSRVLKRFASTNIGNSYLLIDDLSKWKELLGTENRLVALFESLVELAQRKKSVLISTSLRSAFQQLNLAQLKDCATICIDFQTYQGKVYCIPLSMKGRFVPNGIFPFLLDTLVIGKPLSDGVPETMTEKETAQFGKIISSLDEKHRTLFQEAGEAMVLFDIDGDYREFNKSTTDLLGYTNDELKIMSSLSLVSPQHKFRALKFYLELRKRKKGSITADCIKKNGKQIPLQFRTKGLGDGIFLGLLEDLSERRKFEEILKNKEEEYRTLIDNSPFPTMVLHDSELLYANFASLKTFGYESIGEILEKTLQQFFIPESVKRYRKVSRELNTQSENFKFDAQCLRRDGTSFECQVTLSAIPFRGKTCHQLSFLDITEQKSFVEKLATSEKRYRSLVESAVSPIALIQNDTFIYLNKAFLDMFGFESEQQVIGKGIAIIVDELGRDQFSEMIHRRSSSKLAQSVYEFTGVRIDGKKLDCELVTFLSQGKFGEIIGFYRDKTEEKLRQKELHQRFEEVNLLKEIMPEVYNSMDLQKIPHMTLNKIMETLGWEIGGFYFSDATANELKIVHHRHLPETVHSKLSSLNVEEGIGGYLNKTQEPHIFSIRQYPSYLPFKSLFKNANMKAVCFLPLISREKVVGMILLGSKQETDLERHSHDLYLALGNNLGSAIASSRAYQAVKETEQRQSQLIESSSDILYTASPNGSFTFINSNIERLTGYLPKEFYKNTSLWLKLIHTDDKKILLDRTTHLQKIKQTSSEYRILPKGRAAYRWVQDSISIIYDDAGNATTVVGTLRDITEQKDILNSLQKDNVLKTDLLSCIQEGIVIFDRNLKCLYLNTAMRKIIGHTEADAVGKTAFELMPRVQEQEILPLLHHALGGEEVSLDSILYEVSGSSENRNFWTRFSPLKNKDGEITGVIGLSSDISRQKKFEMEMRESVFILNNVIDTMGDLLIITDLKGTVAQVNRTFLNTLGYSRSETIGREFPYQWLIDDEMGRFVLWVANLRKQNWLYDFDMTWRAKDGRLIPMSLSTTLLRNSMGEPIAMLNIARDITDRTHLAKDLENRNKQIEMINRIIVKANQTMNFDEIFATISKEIQTIISCDDINVGLLSEDHRSIFIYASYGMRPIVAGMSINLEQTVSQFAISEQKPVIVSDFLNEEKYKKILSFKAGLRSQISLPISLEGKTFGTLNLGSKDPYNFSEEQMAILQPIAQQIGAIIDRVRLFKQVTEDSAYIHNLLDSIDNIVYTVDTQCRVQEVNKAWQQFMSEFNPEIASNYQGLNLFEILPGDSLKAICQNIVEPMLQGKIHIFAQEYAHQTNRGEKTYQLSINPMIIDKKITGLVFTHTDITALKKTEENLKRSYEQLLALNEISTLISTALDLQKMLKAAIPLLKKTIEATAVLIYLQDSEKGDLVLSHQVGFDHGEFSTLFHLEQSNSATGEVVTTKVPMYIQSKAYLDERILLQNRDVLRSAHLEALAVIPLVSKDKVLGALDILYTKPHEFSGQEKQILMLVGNQFGAAIENAHLYSELRSQIERLTVLYQLSQQLTSILNINQIFQAVHEHLKQVIPYKKLRIDLYDEKTKVETPAYHVENVDGKENFDSTLAQPTIISAGSPNEIVVVTKSSYETPNHKEIFVPMLSKETIIGILAVEGDENTTYTETHFKLLESIGNLTAIAIEKGKLYEETVQKSLEIEQRNKELDDFTYVVSHDLKEPLISVEGFSKIIQADYQDIIQPEGKEYLDSIVGATTRMKKLIDDLLLLSRVSRPTESFKEVFVRGIIDEILTDMEYTVKQKGVNFIVPAELPIVYGNETQLKIVFRNLISNAVKFNNKPNPLVEVGFRNAENNYYLFYIKDNGIGIDREFHEKIFVIFQRLHRREEYEGTGAGLAIVKKIIEIQKGKIWVESEIGEGSTFFFTIPKPIA